MHGPALVRAFVAAAILVPAFALGACGSGADVPEGVAAAFESRYPGRDPVWEVQPYGYEAVYSEDDVEYEAEFSETGEWLETEYETTRAQFPAVVIERVRQEYPGFSITKHEVELTPQGTFYELEVESGGEEGEVYYDDRGNPATNEYEDA